MSAWVVLPSPRRATRLVQRNMLVYKHTSMVIISGFFEPVFYLLGIGLGVGSMVTNVDGIAYAAFVAPGLLAASCMNGAITDGLFNIFFKLHFQKTYDGILATPMRVQDIALGETMWALIRGSLYSLTFLLVVLAIGETLGPRMLLSPLAVLAFPAAVLVAASFSAAALCMATFVKKIQDFDIVMGLIVMPMFLFNGTFFPVSQYPAVIRWIVQTLPVYHSVELLRQCTTGSLRPSGLGHLLYLIVLGLVTFAFAMRRLERALIK
jgi:lipooligosaccharide transport system permease protein